MHAGFLSQLLGSTQAACDSVACSATRIVAWNAGQRILGLESSWEIGGCERGCSLSTSSWPAGSVSFVGHEVWEVLLIHVWRKLSLGRVAGDGELCGAAGTQAPLLACPWGAVSFCLMMTSSLFFFALLRRRETRGGRGTSHAAAQICIGRDQLLLRLQRLWQRFLDELLQSFGARSARARPGPERRRPTSGKEGSGLQTSRYSRSQLYRASFDRTARMG